MESLEIQFEQLVEENAGELTEATKLIQGWINTTTDDSVEALCWYLREAEAVVKACKDEAARLKAVEQLAGGRILWAKERLREIMRRRDTRKLEAGTFRVSLRKGSESAVPTEDIVPSLLPEQFQRQINKVEINKDAIKRALKAGETVDGWILQRGPDSVSVK